MPKDLFEYQIKAKVDIPNLFRKGYLRVLGVSPGGSGKTTMSASFTSNFHIKQYQNQTNKKVAFFTHREELFNQTREEFLEFGNITEPINQDTTIINPNSDTFVAMVETFDRRSDSDEFMKFFKNVGLLFIDEAHRTDFNKILHHFEQSLTLGWTATPVSASKKQPLKSIWNVMHEVAKTSDLQKLNLQFPNVGVVPSDCYELKGIDRSKLKKKGDDFDEKGMSVDFRDKKQKQNTIEKYFELGKGMKGLCFNVDVEHNEDMNNEFNSAGIPSRQLHSNAKKWYGAPSSSLAKNWRKDTLLWLKHTPGAMVHNVGILTTGFNERSIELIMENFSTLSISKHIQCIVRGARPYQYPNGEWKQYYRLLDFGMNCRYFDTDGNNDINWQSYFDMPFSTHNRDGVGGYKSCPECGALNPVSARFCKGIKENFLSQEHEECGYCFPISLKEEDLVPRVMVKFFNDGINVSDMIQYSKIQGWKINGIYYRIIEAVSNLARKSFSDFLVKEQLEFILDIAFKKIRELGKHTGKRCWREGVKKDLVAKLQSDGFILDIEEVGDNEVLEEIKKLEI